jgi:hypothetical protein
MRLRVPETYSVPIAFWATCDLHPALAIIAGLLIIWGLYDDLHREWIGRWTVNG